MEQLRAEIGRFLQFTVPTGSINFSTKNVVQKEGYRHALIQYESVDGDVIPAYLLLPDGDGPFAAVLVHHQHHGQRHWGKSEVCGLVGDPWQTFGPALARRGMAVLAPDSICFEDRRTNQSGTELHEDDVAQHYNEMCYRLLRGEPLIQKVLQDSAQGISILQALPSIDNQRIGILGHSYGGNTVLFHAAVDERIQFACASGAVCSYEHRIAQQTGIEMASAIPGFTSKFDIPDLVACIAPRPFLTVSATDDRFSQDANRVIQLANKKCAAAGISSQITHKRYNGEHALTEERFATIVEWLAAHE